MSTDSEIANEQQHVQSLESELADHRSRLVELNRRKQQEAQAEIQRQQREREVELRKAAEEQNSANNNSGSSTTLAEQIW